MPKFLLPFLLVTTAVLPATAQAQREDFSVRGGERGDNSRRQPRAELPQEQQAQQVPPPQAQPQFSQPHHGGQARGPIRTPDTMDTTPRQRRWEDRHNNNDDRNRWDRERHDRDTPRHAYRTPDHSWQYRDRLDNDRDSRWNDGRWSHGRWSQDWRHDRRYDWRRHHSRNRDYYRLPRYAHPYGYDYGYSHGYRRFSIGIFLNRLFYKDRYWINDPWDYRLPPAYGAYRWVRYYDDVLLVDLRNGRVVDVIHDFFW